MVVHNACLFSRVFLAYSQPYQNQRLSRLRPPAATSFVFGSSSISGLCTYLFPQLLQPHCLGRIPDPQHVRRLLTRQEMNQLKKNPAVLLTSAELASLKGVQGRVVSLAGDGTIDPSVRAAAGDSNRRELLRKDDAKKDALASADQASLKRGQNGVVSKLAGGMNETNVRVQPGSSGSLRLRENERKKVGNRVTEVTLLNAHVHK